MTASAASSSWSQPMACSAHGRGAGLRSSSRSASSWQQRHHSRRPRAATAAAHRSTKAALSGARSTSSCMHTCTAAMPKNARWLAPPTTASAVSRREWGFQDAFRSKAARRLLPASALSRTSATAIDERSSLAAESGTDPGCSGHATSTWTYHMHVCVCVRACACVCVLHHEYDLRDRAQGRRHARAFACGVLRCVQTAGKRGQPPPGTLR